MARQNQQSLVEELQTEVSRYEEQQAGSTYRDTQYLATLEDQALLQDRNQQLETDLKEKEVYFTQMEHMVHTIQNRLDHLAKDNARIPSLEE